MLGFLKGLVSSDKIVDGGLSAMDKLVLTKEERLDYNLKFIEATLPMNRARRFVTVSITSMWVLHAVVALLLFLIRNAEFNDFMQHMLTNITVPFGVVIAFYFNEKLRPGKAT